MRDVVIILGVIGLTAWGLSAGLASSGDLFGRLPPSPTIKYTDETYPFTHARLRERLKRLKPHVEAVVGSSIDLDDVRLFVGDPVSSADRALATSGLELADPASDDFGFVPFAKTVIAMGAQFASMFAYYDASTKDVTLFPATLEAAHPDDMGALLDVVLAHELAHVWQDQAHGVFQQEGVSTDSESDLARQAVLEGSANHVTRSVAKHLGIEATFDWLVATYEEPSHGAPSGATFGHQDRARWIRWVYGEGLRFVDAVHASLDADEAWQRLFHEMPKDVWSIEHPDAWIAQPGDAVQPLDAWARRLKWLRISVPEPSVHRSPWGTRALLRQDLEDRLKHAAEQIHARPWSHCRGGVLCAAQPKRGPLAGKEIFIRVWRFDSADNALLAGKSFETALLAKGLTACLVVVDVETLGDPRTFTAAREGLICESLAFVPGVMNAREVAWGYRVHGSCVVEVECYREGMTPIINEVLDAATASWVDAEQIEEAMLGVGDRGPYARLSRIRSHPSAPLSTLPQEMSSEMCRDVLPLALSRKDGERDVLHWLQQNPAFSSAWMTALGPAVGEEEYRSIERPLILEAALSHSDGHVVRFALSAIAKGRIRLTPWSLRSLQRVAELCKHKDGWIRCVAVRAAEVLSEWEPLDQSMIASIAEDPSPAVREALATSRELLARGPEGLLKRLKQDEHQAVARAAVLKNVDRRSLVERLVDRVIDATKSTRKTVSTNSESDDSSEGGALGTMFEAMLAQHGKQGNGHIVRMLRRHFTYGDESARGYALMSLAALTKEQRALFLSDAIRGLESPSLRGLARDALTKDDWDLAPVHDYLVAMLDDPRWRADVLVVLASEEGRVPDDMVLRIASWIDVAHARVSSAASMVALKVPALRERALRRLSSLWGEISSSYRMNALVFMDRSCAHHATTVRLRNAALVSPFTTERAAAMNRGKVSVRGVSYVEALLDGVEGMGPHVAGELWIELLRKTKNLEGDEKTRACDLIAQRLNAWCKADAFPRIDGKQWWFLSHTSPGESSPLAAALDRCILLDSPRLFRVVCALMRIDMDHKFYPEPPRVRDAINRLLSMQDSAIRIPPKAKSSLISALVDREAVGLDSIRSVIMHAAAGTPKGHRIRIRRLLWRQPERIDAALLLVPELLTVGKQGSGETALEILGAAKPLSEPMLEMLRSYAVHALPKWRKRIEKLMPR